MQLAYFCFCAIWLAALDHGVRRDKVRGGAMQLAYFCFCAIRLPFVDVSGRAYIVGYVQMFCFLW